MENKLNDNQKAKAGLSIPQIFRIFKNYLALMLAIIVAFVVAGVVYTYLLKPEYTVTHKIGFNCDNSPEGENIMADMNAMTAYGETIMDLFDEGVVLDRANYYYQEFDKARTSDGLTVEEFLEKIEQEDGYTPPTNENEQLGYILKEKVQTSKLSVEDELYAFNVSYTEGTTEKAREKLKVLIYAFQKECGEIKMVGEQETPKYFGEFEVFVSDWGADSLSYNISRIKTVVIFGLGGIMVSILIALGLNFIDKTIKSKDELEDITGVSVVALIERGEE